MRNQYFKTRARAMIAAAVLVGMVPTFAGGCFGTFQLTQKVYDFNRTISHDKWIQWFAFLVFAIVPIYLISVGVDLISANSVEFWDGRNPITAYGPNGEILTATPVSSGMVRLEITDAKGSKHTLLLVREAESVAAFSTSGSVLARVADVNGKPAIVGGLLAREP